MAASAAALTNPHAPSSSTVSAYTTAARSNSETATARIRRKARRRASSPIESSSSDGTAGRERSRTWLIRGSSVRHPTTVEPIRRGRTLECAHAESYAYPGRNLDRDGPQPRPVRGVRAGQSDRQTDRGSAEGPDRDAQRVAGRTRVHRPHLPGPGDRVRSGPGRAGGVSAVQLRSLPDSSAWTRPEATVVRPRGRCRTLRTDRATGPCVVLRRARDGRDRDGRAELAQRVLVDGPRADPLRGAERRPRRGRRGRLPDDAAARAGLVTPGHDRPQRRDPRVSPPLPGHRARHR